MDEELHRLPQSQGGQPPRRMIRLVENDPALEKPLRIISPQPVRPPAPPAQPTAAPKPIRPGGAAARPRSAPHKPVDRAQLHEAAERARSMRGRQTRHSLGTRYRVGPRLGEGGTGTVYKAHDMLLDMAVAVKVLLPALARDPAALATIRREARLTMALSHRHIVRLHNLEKAGSTYFLVMEYVEGETLRRMIDKSGPFPVRDADIIIEVAADAVSHAHRRGILHNDLKADNLMLDTNGVVKVIDFGIGCLLNRQWSSEFIMGTPAYMSPEQARGEELDPRTDVYAMGVLAYELIAGRLPCSGSVTIKEVSTGPVLDFSGVPVPVRAVLEKATAFDKHNRLDSARTLHSALHEAMRACWPEAFPARPS